MWLTVVESICGYYDREGRRAAARRCRAAKKPLEQGIRWGSAGGGAGAGGLEAWPGGQGGSEMVFISSQSQPSLRCKERNNERFCTGNVVAWK